MGDADRAAQLIAAYKANRPDSSPAELWSVLATDHVFRIPAVRWPSGSRTLGNPVYMYRFDWATPVFGGQMGACHALEIPFMFNNLDATGSEMFTGPASQEMRDMARTMHTAWHTFARTGEPAGSGGKTEPGGSGGKTEPGDNWPRYTSGDRRVMRFDLESEVVDDPDGAEREAWEGLL